MKNQEVILHEKGMLLSIKPFQVDNYYDKIFFIELLSNYITISKRVYIIGRRPEYDASTWIHKIEQRILNIKEATSIQITNRDISIVIYDSSNKHLAVDIITYIWNAYEQPSVIFMTNSNIDIKTHISLLSTRTSWENVVSASSSYCFFRGIEDDVLWLGRSSELSFMNLPTIISKF